jgi:hypothetical protein
MSAIREELGHKFEEYRAKAADSVFSWDRIGMYDRDELLALIWWLYEDRKRARQNLRPELELTDVAG